MFYLGFNFANIKIRKVRIFLFNSIIRSAAKWLYIPIASSSRKIFSFFVPKNNVRQKNFQSETPRYGVPLVSYHDSYFYFKSPIFTYTEKNITIKNVKKLTTDFVFGFQILGI